MYMKNNFILLTVAMLMSLMLIGCLGDYQTNNLPCIAIANYGPHASLDDAIAGLKQHLAKAGYIEGKTIRYAISQVNFDTSLIPQMITQLLTNEPKVLVAMTTPIAQFAQGKTGIVPVVYNVITDPVAAGLIPDEHHSTSLMTGSSDRQNMHAVLTFIKRIVPAAQRIGLLYGTGETNDAALLAMMKQATQELHMELIAIPVAQSRDIHHAMEQLKDAVDCMYVGTSGTIQPALPLIAQCADSFGIPVINVNEDAVTAGLVVASFGVNYERVGANAGKLVEAILKGDPITQLQPIYPTLEDHVAYISTLRAEHLGMAIPTDMNNLIVVR